MDNIIKFKKKQPIEFEENIFTMTVSQNQDGEFLVHVEVNDVFTDAEVFEAMMTATVKFGCDQGILIDEEEDDPSTIH